MSVKKLKKIGSDRKIQPVLIKKSVSWIKIIIMDKLNDKRQRERELLYQALGGLVGLPRQRTMGPRDAVIMWRFADAL